MLAVVPALLAFIVSPAHASYNGRVVDASTGKPVPGAVVTLGDRAQRTSADGTFRFEGAGHSINFRAAGFKRLEVPAVELHGIDAQVPMTPFKVKGLYLSVYGIGSSILRNHALQVLEQNNLNALVVDVKGDRGLIPFKVDLPLAAEIGAQKVITVKDMKGLLAELKARGIYLIARIVVFKDDLLAAAKPEWAVKTRGGDPFRDREKLRWVDPFRREVWDYTISVARAAAEVGFDEVQFDYVRFPDNRGLAFSQPATEDSRTQAVTGFLKAAQEALTPHNVMVSADIFGYVLWNTSDTDIGQKIEPIMESVDVASPMLYPSGYQFGIPNYRNPVLHPYEIIYLSLKRAQERSKAPSACFRPWIQAFRDYAFGGKVFAENELRVQIKAAEDFGASGFLIWNPRNVYPKGGFHK
jgi:hypothetical protein